MVHIIMRLSQNFAFWGIRKLNVINSVTTFINRIRLDHEHTFCVDYNRQYKRSNRTKKADTGNRTGLLAGVGLEPTTSGL